MGVAEGRLGDSENTAPVMKAPGRVQIGARHCWTLRAQAADQMTREAAAKSQSSTKQLGADRQESRGS